MIRIALAAMAVALTACAPPLPDSGAGVGFQDYNDYNSYRATREAELRGSSLPAPAPVTATPLSAEAPITAATLQSAGIGSAPSAPATGRVVAIPENDASISDEQNFAAVADRQTIQSDADRLRAQRQAYQVINPTALPSRSGSDGPNIVQYALTNRNPVGQKAYTRSSITTNSRYQRNCDKYTSPDLAQEAFLRSGGPERDKMGIDPDGDGFACSWDPTPFRRAANG